MKRTENMTNSLAFYSIVVIFGLLFVASFTPTSDAAKKIQDEKGISNLKGGTGVCDVPAKIRGETKFHTTMWDNGHFNSHILMKGTIVSDQTGEKIGNFKRVVNISGTQDDLPLSQQINVVITCEGLGVEQNSHVGCTIQRDGIVKCHGGFINF